MRRPHYKALYLEEKERADKAEAELTNAIHPPGPLLFNPEVGWKWEVQEAGLVVWQEEARE